MISKSEKFSFFLKFKRFWMSYGSFSSEIKLLVQNTKEGGAAQLILMYPQNLVNLDIDK